MRVCDFFSLFIFSVVFLWFAVQAFFYVALCLCEKTTHPITMAAAPSTKTERTFIAVKPDGVQRGLVGEIIARFERKGFKLVALKMVKPTSEMAAGHYKDLSAKKFFPSLCEYFSSGPIVGMVWEGLNAVKSGRVLLGATNPAESLPGTIRGDMCIDVGRNICHGSDSVESANHEIAFWFKPEELITYSSHSAGQIYE